MALRVAFRRFLGHSPALTTAEAASARFMSSQPTVFDKIVTVNVIDKEGRRHALRGLEGQTLRDVLLANESALPVEGDVLCLSPEGRGEFEAHVKVPNEFLQLLPAPDGDDKWVLEQVGENITSNSRLASRIQLNKSTDNMLVALGDIYPWRTL